MPNLRVLSRRTVGHKPTGGECSFRECLSGTIELAITGPFKSATTDHNVKTTGQGRDTLTVGQEAGVAAAHAGGLLQKGAPLHLASTTRELTSEATDVSDRSSVFGLEDRLYSVRIRHESRVGPCVRSRCCLRCVRDATAGGVPAAGVPPRNSSQQSLR